MNKQCPACFKQTAMNEGVCSACGFDEHSPVINTHLLPVGTLLANKYKIGKMLGEGGFGITYLGFDTLLEMKVAVKEYYPGGFANREHTDNTHSVYSYPGERGEYFQRGMERFMKEAKRLSKFAGEPGVVTVRDFFYENNTAYIVMEFVEGTSLKNVMKQHGKISEASVLIMLEPIIETLAKMHKAGILHRDIAPDNIMLQPDGTAKLIDFGASADIESNNNSTLVIVKYGYAPEEQHDRTRARQGTWTDVFGICATIFCAIEGVPPTDSSDRLRGAAMSEFTVPVSEKTKRAIMNGLALYPTDRTQTMDDLLRELHTEVIPPIPPKPPKPIKKSPAKLIAAIGGIAAAIAITIGIFVIAGGKPEAVPTATETAITATAPAISEAIEATTPETTVLTTTQPPDTANPPETTKANGGYENLGIENVAANEDIYYIMPCEGFTDIIAIYKNENYIYIGTVKAAESEGTVGYTEDGFGVSIDTERDNYFIGELKNGKFDGYVMGMSNYISPTFIYYEDGEYTDYGFEENELPDYLSYFESGSEFGLIYSDATAFSTLEFVGPNYEELSALIHVGGLNITYDPSIEKQMFKVDWGYDYVFFDADGNITLES